MKLLDHSTIDKLSDKQKAKAIEDAHLGVFFPNETQLYNPLMNIPEIVRDYPEMYYIWVMSQPEYFWFTCKELFGINLAPFQCVVLEQLWNHKFPMLVASRGASKTFTLGVYALLRMLFLRERKVLICGSGFRQSKLVFQYAENIVNNSKILTNLIGGKDAITHGNEGHKMEFGSSSILAIPIGQGDTIRGLRANDILADEFAAQNPEVFETVIAGFGAVSSSPTEKTREEAKRKLAKYVKIKLEDDSTLEKGNQIIISGTAYYSFNHFSNYHDRYKKIIKTRGNPEKLRDLGIDATDLNYKDYCVIRLPVKMIPPGFMDSSQVARAKATVHSGVYEMEYEAVFSSDSNGFFKRSLIENCTVKDKDITQSNGNVLEYDKITFEPMLTGSKQRSYIMGIDPAMTQDNFAIVILEVCEDHRKIVYCWTTNKDDHRNKMKLGISVENNYYSYCARKIRGLVHRFNITRIALDIEGGGRSVMEALNDKNLLRPGEVEYWPTVDPNEPQDTDFNEGRHFIDVVKLVKAEYTNTANHGMKKDMEDRVLLFPYYDGISLMESDYISKESDNEDTFERCAAEIEELKDELCTINLTETTTGRQHWDTPELKLPNGKKGRMRKDRYSALLMANKSARDIDHAFIYDIGVTDGGGFASAVRSREQDKKMFRGGSILAAQLNDLYAD